MPNLLILNEIVTHDFNYNGLNVITMIGLFMSIAGYLIILGVNFIGLPYTLAYIGINLVFSLFVLMLINIGISQFGINNKLLWPFIILWVKVSSDPRTSNFYIHTIILILKLCYMFFSMDFDCFVLEPKFILEPGEQITHFEDAGHHNYPDPSRGPRGRGTFSGYTEFTNYGNTISYTIAEYGHKAFETQYKFSPDNTLIRSQLDYSTGRLSGNYLIRTVEIQNPYSHVVTKYSYRSGFLDVGYEVHRTQDGDISAKYRVYTLHSRREIRHNLYTQGSNPVIIL